MAAQADTADDPRWARVVARDPAADGQFWYSVTSTGVYCRPSCPARTAHPRFVRLHATLDEARATGHRPCGRCHPEEASLYERNRETVERACALVRDSEHELPLGVLAATLHCSPSHLHRLFKDATGPRPTRATALRARPAQKVRKIGSGSAASSASSDSSLEAYVSAADKRKFSATPSSREQHA